MTASSVQGTKVAGAGSLGTIAGDFTALRVGELLIVGVGWVDAAGTITCTVADAAGQTYTSVPAGKNRNATNTYATQLFYRVSTVRADANTTVTATFSTATTFRNLAIERYVSDRGPWDRDPIDKSANSTGNSVNLSSGNMAATGPGELAIGWGSHNSGTLTAAGSFTARQGNATDTMLEDFFQTVAATIAATETASVSDQWTMNGALFFDAVASSGPPAQPPQDLLDALARLAYAGTGEQQVGTTVQVTVDTGLAPVGLSSVAAARKVVVATATVGLGLSSTPTARKVSTPSATAPLGLSSAGVARKVGVDSARGAFGLSSTGGAAKHSVSTGPAALGLSSRTTALKLAVAVGTATAGLGSNAAALHVGVGAVRTGLGLSTYHSSADIRHVVALAALGLSAWHSSEGCPPPTIRPDTGTTPHTVSLTARPSTGTTSRPDTGDTARPDTGQTDAC